MFSRCVVGILVVLMVLVSVSLAAPPEPPGFKLGGDAKRGAAVFAKRCAICHGATGDGNGTLKTDPPARDFRTPALLSSRSDWEIYLVIRDGGTAIGLSPKMLGWNKLMTDQEMRDAGAFVRTFVPGSEGVPPAAFSVLRTQPHLY